MWYRMLIWLFCIWVKLGIVVYKRISVDNKFFIVLCILLIIKLDWVVGLILLLVMSGIEVGYEWLLG